MIDRETASVRVWGETERLRTALLEVARQADAMGYPKWADAIRADAKPPTATASNSKNPTTSG